MERNFRYLAITLTIAITVGSLIDVIPKPSINISDKLVHSSAYLILTLSWLLSFKLILKKSRLFFLVLFAIFIYGIIIEVLQEILTSYRQADYYDIIANLLGITIAGFIFYAVFKKK